MDYEAHLQVQRKVTFKVEEVSYNFGDGQDAPEITFLLMEFKLPGGTPSAITIGNGGTKGGFWLHMTRSTFHAVTGKFWRGTEEDVKRLAKDFRGKEFSLDFQMTLIESENKVSSAA